MSVNIYNKETDTLAPIAGRVANAYTKAETDAKILDGVSNLDNMAKFGMVELGHWYGGDTYHPNCFRSKRQYAIDGNVTFENNSNKYIIIIKLSDYSTYDRAVSPNEKISLNLTEPCVWYIDAEEVLTESILDSYLSNIRIYAETGTIDNVVTNKISNSTNYLAPTDLLDKNALQFGYFNAFTGELIPASNWKSGYIPVENGATYEVTHGGAIWNGAGCIWLDASKNFISLAFDRTVASPTIVTAPPNAKYLGVSATTVFIADNVTDLDVFHVTRYSKSNVQLTEEIANVGSPNLLDNAWFTITPIGTELHNGDSSCRWRCFGGKQTFTRNGVEFSNDGGTYSLLCQVIDDETKRRLDGKTLTASILFSDGTMYSGSNKYVYGQAYNSFLNRENISLDIDDNSFVGFRILIRDERTVKAVKFEVGNTSTLLHDSGLSEGYTNKTVSEVISKTIVTTSFGTLHINKCGRIVTIDCIESKLAVQGWTFVTNVDTEFIPIHDAIMWNPSGIIGIHTNGELYIQTLDPNITRIHVCYISKN